MSRQFAAMKLIGLVLLGQTGCAGLMTTSDDAQKASAESEKVVLEGGRHETRLLAGDETKCLVEPYEERETIAPLLLGVAGQLVPAAVNEGVTAFAKYLKDSADDTSSELQLLSASLYMYRLRAGKPVPNLRCITVVRGRFGNAGVRPTYDLEEWVNFDPDNKMSAAFFTESKLIEIPEMIVEFHAQYSPDVSAFRLIPRHVYYRKTAARLPGDGVKDLEFGFVFSRPTHKATDEARAGAAFAVVPVKIPAVRIGTVLSDGLLEEAGTAWMPVRPLTEQEQNFGAGQIAFALVAPTNVAVSVKETDEPNAFRAFWGDVLEEKQTDVAKLINDELQRRLGISGTTKE